MDPLTIDIISIIGIIFYFMVSALMAYAILTDVAYRGNSWVDCIFVNIWVYLFGFVVWPILVVILYTIKLYRAFVKEIKHPW